MRQVQKKSYRQLLTRCICVCVLFLTGIHLGKLTCALAQDVEVIETDLEGDQENEDSEHADFPQDKSSALEHIQVDEEEIIMINRSLKKLIEENEKLRRE